MWLRSYFGMDLNKAGDIVVSEKRHGSSLQKGQEKAQTNSIYKTEEGNVKT